LNTLANTRVRSALELLDERERELVIEGVRLYAKALGRSSKLNDIEIRTIEKHENGPLENLLRSAMREFGAVGPGCAYEDSELHDMHKAYRGKRTAYFVASRGETLLGGAGIAPLKGAEADTCELRKMYLVPDVRGIGLGKKLLGACIQRARRMGYRRCYVETLQHMTQAHHLYSKSGFERLKAPLGDTGHFRYDCWASADLNRLSQAQSDA
jgi:putative acetyltransferase